MVQSGLIVASTAQISLSKINMHLPLKFVYQHLLDFELVNPTPSNPM